MHPQMTIKSVFERPTTTAKTLSLAVHAMMLPSENILIQFTDNPASFGNRLICSSFACHSPSQHIIIVATIIIINRGFEMFDSCFGLSLTFKTPCQLIQDVAFCTLLEVTSHFNIGWDGQDQQMLAEQWWLVCQQDGQDQSQILAEHWLLSVLDW